MRGGDAHDVAGMMAWMPLKGEEDQVINGWIDGLIDCVIDGWMDGLIDRLIDRLVG